MWLTVTGEKETTAFRYLGSRSSLLRQMLTQRTLTCPYFGQVMWFMRFHHEQLPSATELYQSDTKGVFFTLDGVLAKSAWLVDGKCTIAGLSFIPWDRLAITAPLEDVDVKKKFRRAWA